MKRTLSRVYRENKIYLLVIFLLVFFMFSLLYKTYNLEPWLLFGFLTSCAAVLVVLIGDIYGRKVMSEKPSA